MSDLQFFKNIRNLIAKGQLNDALSKLMTATADENLHEHNELILFSAKYSELEKMELDNRISFENYQNGTNKLLRSLITLVDNLENDLPTKSSESTANLTLPEIYKSAIARAKVITILLAAEKGLSIKEIYQLSGLNNRKYIIAALDELIAGKVVKRFREDGDSLNILVDGKRELVERWL